MSEIDSLDLDQNIDSIERKKLAEDFLQLYPFLKKDKVFVEFMRQINGIQFGSKEFGFTLYGFGFPEDELMLSLDQYLTPNDYLLVGEYIDKKILRNWKGIVYAYYKPDVSPVIYARFDLKNMPEIKGRYYPLCIGFDELLKIVLHKSFDEQFQEAYLSDHLDDA